MLLASRPAAARAFRLSSPVTIALAVVVLAAQAAFAATPVPVIAQKAIDEFQASASANYIVWTQNSEEHPRHVNVYAKAPGGSPIRVNERGSSAFNAAIDGTTVVYSRFTSDDFGDLRLYDLRTGERSDPGDGVNTRYVELQPNLSGRYLFFERAKFGGATRFAKLILYDRRTERSTVLAEVDPGTGFVDADQVNGDWLVWEYCAVSRPQRYSECDVFRYRISTGHAVRLPNPGAQQYSPGVTSDGTVYYIRNGGPERWRCGAHARIVRYPVGGPATVLASIPHGKDVFAEFALEGQYGLVTDYFDVTRCSDQVSDVYKLEDVRTG